MFATLYTILLVAFGLFLLWAMFSGAKKKGHGDGEVNEDDRQLSALVHSRLPWAKLSAGQKTLLERRGVRLACTDCGELVHPGTRRCPHCGMTWTATIWDRAMSTSQINLVRRKREQP